MSSNDDNNISGVVSEARRLQRDRGPPLDLHEVAYAAEQAVGDARRAPRAPGDLLGSRRLDGDVQDSRRTARDCREFGGSVVLEVLDDAEAVSERRRE